jgi:lipopolysaccharide/colanic/teichoic acid biosynthesis glycosyltransferase
MGRIAKRLLDLIGSFFGLILLSPFLTLLAIAIYFKLGRPVFYKQERPGLYGNPFILYKFRSMTQEVDKEGHPLPDEKRLTSFGKFLRRWSLDEFPELWNVFRGDMSLVGPRPLLMEYLPRYSAEQRRRHDVKPGLTGWAQINGRNAITWDDRFRLDVWYVDHWNFWLDIKILFRTLFHFLKREGITAEGHATMPKFLGATGKSDTSH